MLWKMENELCAAGEEEEKPVCLASPLLQGLIHSKHPNPFQPFSIHLKSKHLNPFSKHLNLFQSISIHPKGKLVGGAEARARGQPWQTKGDWNPNLLFLNWTKTQNIKIKQKR